MARTSVPSKVRKRDGSLVPFETQKITQAIQAAAAEVLNSNARAAAIGSRVAPVVIDRLAQRCGGSSPSIEDIQDAIEAALMSEGYSHIAKAYILYRESRSQIRSAKSALGLKDDLKLPLNSVEVLRRRYLLKDRQRRIIETPSQLFHRVAQHVAGAEVNYRSGCGVEEVEEKFCRMMHSLEFLPNSPTLMNAGTKLGQLSACFVIPVADSIEGIFKALTEMARIHQTGGGTGFSFSSLRPRGDLVGSTQGHASGPLSFMGIFDKATEVIVQGGKRRGANMGILRCDHPDIVEFVEAKMAAGVLENFNISVGVTNRFMRAAAEGRPFALVNPRDGATVKKVNARALFDMIVHAAWRTGDPGLIFLDQINKCHPLSEIGSIEATNPCGEVPLLPYESCILASINLARMVKDAGGRPGNAGPDWNKLRDRVHWGVRFLDDVIDANKYPLASIAKMTLAGRKIGLGVMGFADMLIRMGIAYDSPEAVTFARKLMRFIHTESCIASERLAAERGVFPCFGKSVYASQGCKRRNATVNTIAPTGTISIIAGCSSGIEPLFAVSFVRHVLSGRRLFEINPLFERAAYERGFHRHELLAEIARHRSLRDVQGIPSDVKRLFVTAFDVAPRQHLAIQAAFQKYTDNAVSKTINLPADATVDDVRDIYRMAYQLKCKGITVYRYGSKPEQVLSVGDGDRGSHETADEFTSVDTDYSGGCFTGTCDF